MRCRRSSISSYVDGCHCDGCKEANRLRARRYRNAKRVSAGANVPCLICGDRFHKRAHMYDHEVKVHPSEDAA